MSPVDIFGFLLLRSATVPVAFSTNSRFSLRADSQREALVSMLKTNWVMP